MKIQLRTCDDWIAVYKDGAKVYEGHSCPLSFGLKALGVEFEEVDLDDQMDEIGNLFDGGEPFPQSLGAN